MARELASRLVLGPLMAAIALVLVICDLIWGGHWGSLVLSGMVVVLGSVEYRLLMRPWAPGIPLLPLLVPGIALLLLVWPGFALPGGSPATILALPVLGIGLIWMALGQMMRYGLVDFLPNVLTGFFGLFWIGAATSLLLALSCIEAPGHPGRGPQLLITAMACIKLGDTLAFFGGRLLGRHKLCPSISPGKTREGFACSLVGSVGGAWLASWLLASAAGNGLGPFEQWWQPLVFGLVLGPLGALGDLVESALKRSVAVKDSGRSLAGFGGFLDVFDAVLLAAPAAFLLGLLL